MKSFLSKIKLIKSLSEISTFDILANNFQIKDLNRYLQPEYCIPLSRYLEQLNFKYDFDSPTPISQRNNFFNKLVLFILLSSAFRHLAYIFFDSEDQLFRLYFGELYQFLVDKVSFAAIAVSGCSFYGLSMFYLFHYWPEDQLQWFNVFNAIEGNPSFVKIKILIKKSAKKLIRFSLIMLTSCSVIHYMISFASIVFIIFPLVKLPIKQFLFIAFPWAIFSMFWVFYCIGYLVSSFYIVIICYYYQLRLDQLEVYGNSLLKRKQVTNFNQRILRLLYEYDAIMTEVNQFNKFTCKMIFFLYIFLTSTVMFLIYNIIYVKINLFVLLIHYLVVFVMITSTLLIVLNGARIPLQLRNNKRNLISLNYHQNLTTKTKIKV